MTAAPAALQRLARHAVTQPVEPPVPNDDEGLLARKGPWRLAFRAARRRAEVAASGQAALELRRIDPAWRRAIWFHPEMPQIGDSLLDLAPRSLLVEHGIAVDVVLPRSLAGVYRGDRWFGRVIADDEPIDASGHDFAIVDSRAGKALAPKRRAAPRLPWVSVRGDYLAYDYQRGLLAARRFADLLGVRLDAAAEHRHARQKLDVVVPAPIAAAAAGRVAITLGGVQPHRTYRGWPEIALSLVARGFQRLALLGSGNGVALAEAVKEALAGSAADVLDLVGRTDIVATRGAMAACAAIVAVDGGLMHLACTTQTPMLALFDATSLPVWRVPPDFDGATLVAPGADVNGIAPHAVIDAALAYFAAHGVMPEIAAR